MYSFEAYTQRKWRNECDNISVSAHCKIVHFLSFLLQPEKNDSEPGSQRIKPVFIEDANFGRQISYQHAAVHIPTDIYEGCK